MYPPGYPIFWGFWEQDSSSAALSGFGSLAGSDLPLRLVAGVHRLALVNQDSIPALLKMRYIVLNAVNGPLPATYFVVLAELKFEINNSFVSYPIQMGRNLVPFSSPFSPSYR